MRGLGVIVLLTGCSVAVMASGDFGAAGILLLLLTMLLVVRWAPFRNLPLSHRRAARIASTAVVLVGWFAGGALLWGWGVGNSVVAGVVAVFALGRAAYPPGTRSPLAPLDSPPARDPRADMGGFISSRSPVSRRERVLARCVHEDKDTVQDDYEIIIGRWFGTGFPGITHKSVRGKMGQRATFRSCTECGSLYHLDEPARTFIQGQADASYFSH